MDALKKTLALLIFVITCTECGRKQRTLFHFPEKESLAINRLALPAVRGLNVSAQGDDALVTWQPVILPSPNGQQQMQFTLIGYHVYRFVRGRFISRHPITKQPILVTQFLDSSYPKNKYQLCYMVRAVYGIDNQTIQGPTSHIASINDVQ